MKTVIILAEGQCEETFIRDVLAPEFWRLEIFLEARCIPTSSVSKGGAVSFERLLIHVRNTMRERNDTYISTMLDLYQLDKNFPEHNAASSLTDIYQRTECLERALHRAVIDKTGCRPERFVPHIQPHEFEGLLFSNVTALVSVEPKWKSHLPDLKKIRSEFETPEHINNSYETKPSKRLEDTLAPKYRKTRHGPQGAKQISLPVIESECRHFHDWMEKLRNLPPLFS